MEQNYSLIVACENGHLDMVMFLVSVGADIQASLDAGIEAACINNHYEIVKFLLSVENTDYDYDNLVLTAVAYNHKKLVKLLLSQGHSNYYKAINFANKHSELEISKFFLQEIKKSK